MGLKNPFRRDQNRHKAGPLEESRDPWWAWGPLGLIWFGGSHGNHSVPPGHYNHLNDSGGDFGGIDGGGAGL